MPSKKYKNVNEYIASSVEEAHSVMKELRRVITATTPQAEEEISWNVPIYKYHGVLAGFSVAKNHVSFGIDSLESSDRDALKEQGYKTGSKTIQIKFDQKVPATIIKKLLKAQAKKLSQSKK